MAGLWILLGSSACVRVVGSVAQPTAIERQLLGAYQELDDALVLTSSARGPGPAGGPDLDRQALRQRLLQRFNEDDVEQLKSWGCLGEGRDGRLRELECDEVVQDPTWNRVRGRVVAEENQAREIILRWAAAQVAEARGMDAPTERLEQELRDAYVSLLREASGPGDLVQGEDGVWRRAGEVP